ncbi:hypothetical protein A3G54_00755 [Candidatus Giovannonibacteria bacterium RIFCSPLOWO2_12_FULL_44_15]|uniref:Glycosyltransferase RgtA/B/C/D-like domain-containing protein n=1 Tax=Candidatus Giovannonibacteria bacterium RIFCSPLOWO2_12_FULL_44_15 TaxID=1798364 RepID=A0A1F5Y031_9BACT|nr:MAG: hypothetical protein A3E62_00710 [Candidatus Giovannonibacteria bacterium RIFCSPHIGHO2_12_FULL_44_29]OGF93515.1 MAG: hypothetical protein A3G54_00755 [Candidatus Giovannonibacteria bacterium RIFCSPLOWO2_12_FULL_44_15]
MVNLMLFLISGYGLGLLAVKFLDPLEKLSLLERFIARLIVGFLGIGFEILFFSLAARNLSIAIYLSFAINIALAFKHYRKDFIGYRESLRTYFASYSFLSWHSLILTFLFLAFSGVFLQVLTFDAQGLPQGTLIGWGDIAYHLDMIRHLALSDPFVLDQPIANGAPLTYPLMINFLSAILLRLGLNLFLAWYIPTIIFSITIFWGLYALGRRLFSSKIWVVALIILIFFGSGLGFIYFFQDLRNAYIATGWSGVRDIIDAPPHQYTHMDMRTGGKPQSADSPLNIVWITPVISFLSHQRSFVLGFSILILLLIGWVVYNEEVASKDKNYFVRWLPLLGLLPLIHAHSLIAAAIIFSVLFARQIFNRSAVKFWLIGLILAILVALPQIMFVFHLKFIGAESGSSFLKLWWGWMTCQHSASWFVCDPNTKGTDTSVLWFWTKNFGVIFWVWLVGVLTFIRLKSPRLVRALIPASLLLFAVPNLMLFQPWEFDNNKVLFYWWLFAVIIILTVLERIPWNSLRTASLALLLLCGSLAGFIDASSRVRQTIDSISGNPVREHFGYYGEWEVAAGAWIVANTKSNDAFLTSDGANNFVPMLTGRPIFLGFPGWLWTQGNSQAILLRQVTARQFFQTGNPSSLCVMGVRWLIWEPSLFNTYPEARNSDPSQLGNIGYTQNTPYGQRDIIRLRCSDSA